MGNIPSNDKSSHKSNAEFISDTNKKLKDAGLSHNVLNDLTQSINDRFRCDDECQRQRDIAALKDKWNDDKDLYNELPEQINNNERKYYLEAKGKDYYNSDILKVRYTNIFQKFKDNKINDLDNIKHAVDDELNNYTSEKTAVTRMEQLYKDTLKKNKALKIDIDNIYKKVFTDERKVYYEDQQIENVENYYMYIFIAYFVLLVLYLLAGPFIWKQKYKSILIWVLIALYVAFPFLLNYLVPFISEFI